MPDYTKEKKLFSENIEIIKKAFPVTVPVLLGYFAIGVAFGMLLIHAGYPWFFAPVMSIIVYAGSAQYIAVGFFTGNAGFFEIAAVTLLVNSRHMFYGLSLLDKYRETGKYKPYLVFALTDETYALLTSIKVPPGIDKKRFYFFVSLLDQSYWVLGSLIGAIIGKTVTFNAKGLDFALTALFTVLLIEQYRSCKPKIPFAVALVCGILSMVFAKSNMLLVSIISSITILLVFSRGLRYDEAF